MKALSLIQPWATLVAIGAKRVETRDWPTDYRGPIAIHASKWVKQGANGRRLYVSREVEQYLLLCYREPFTSALTRAGYDRIGQLPSGALVATARLVDVVCTERAVDRVDAYEREFGNFGPRRFAWFLEDVRPLATPIGFRGMPGLWDLPDAVLVQTSAQGEASR